MKGFGGNVQIRAVWSVGAHFRRKVKVFLVVVGFLCVYMVSGRFNDLGLKPSNTLPYSHPVCIRVFLVLRTLVVAMYAEIYPDMNCMKWWRVQFLDCCTSDDDIF